MKCLAFTDTRLRLFLVRCI